MKYSIYLPVELISTLLPFVSFSNKCNRFISKSIETKKKIYNKDEKEILLPRNPGSFSCDRIFFILIGVQLSVDKTRR